MICLLCETKLHVDDSIYEYDRALRLQEKISLQKEAKVKQVSDQMYNKERQVA